MAAVVVSPVCYVGLREVPWTRDVSSSERPWRVGTRSLSGQVQQQRPAASAAQVIDKRSNEVVSSERGWQRREWLLATTATSLVLDSVFAERGWTEELATTDRVASEGGVSSSSDVQLRQGAAPPAGQVEEEEWKKVRGDGFLVQVPPGFQDITPEPEVDDSPMSTLKEGPAKGLFAARFASTDMEEVISVLVRPTTSLKLSFFEVKDVTDLGSLLEAAKLLVPPGAKLLAARAYTATPRNVPRTYYLYEFVAQDMHVAMSAAVAKGKVFVLGATTAESHWKNAAGRMRSVARTFSLVI